MAKKTLNKNLHKAHKAKNDEFYTQLIDIEKELKNYKEQFKGKVVYCNCDDPFESNFFKYFAANFNVLMLKKLISTSYIPSPIAGKQLPLFEIEGLKPEGKEPFKIEINEVRDFDKDGAIGLTDVEWLLKHDANAVKLLKGDGDFRSEECIELLKEADVVVTNPPFSLFREYVAQLAEYKKKFLIIGNKNAITYKESFKLIKGNKLWFGYSSPKEFFIPGGELTKRVQGLTRWFTNLDITKRHETLVLYKKYTPEEYPTYDNYDAIEVSKVLEIPKNYEGVMGVPVTFLDKYNPKQFEILGITDRDTDSKYRIKTYTKNDSIKYSDLNRRSAIMVNGNLKPVYARLLIRQKK